MACIHIDIARCWTKDCHKTALQRIIKIMMSKAFCQQDLDDMFIYKCIVYVHCQKLVKDVGATKGKLCGCWKGICQRIPGALRRTEDWVQYLFSFLSLHFDLFFSFWRVVVRKREAKEMRHDHYHNMVEYYSIAILVFTSNAAFVVVHSRKAKGTLSHL